MKITSNSTPRMKKKMKTVSHVMSSQTPPKAKEHLKSKQTETKDRRRRHQRQKKTILA